MNRQERARCRWRSKRFIQYYKIEMKCQVCNSKNKIEVHHADYKKPFEVNFLCRQCHLDFHNNKIKVPSPIRLKLKEEYKMPKRVTEKEYSERKFNILKEFMSIFAEKGFEKTRVGDVTVVKRPEVYRFFEDKHEILEEIVERIEEMPITKQKGKFIYKFRQYFNDKVKEEIEVFENQIFDRLSVIKQYNEKATDEIYRVI